MRKFSRHLRGFLVLVIVFAVFYSVDQSRETKVVVIPHELSSGEVIDNLYERGYIRNKVSYWYLKIATKFGVEYQPGAYSLKSKMGALAIQAKLADPDYRYVHVEAGLRKEEVAEVLKKKLDWDDETKESFISTFPICTFTGGEGYFFPGTYLIHKEESPEVIKEEMRQRLYDHIEEYVHSSEKNILNIGQIVNIASLIQREAGGKNDMRLISGIIWNRLFNDMPLQIDATLQYVKGNDEVWWPLVHSKDKFLDSPYNTYQNKGLPPGPIASPSPYAIEAALNPSDTNCLFYLHDRGRNIHCSTTYEGHKRNISYYLP